MATQQTETAMPWRTLQAMQERAKKMREAKAAKALAAKAALKDRPPPAPTPPPELTINPTAAPSPTAAPVVRGAPTAASLSALPSLTTDWTIPYPVLVTPAMAEAWINSGNNKNRPLRRMHVNSITADMSEQRWKLTHQGIAFSASGELFDGQHRLQAIIKSGVAAPLLVFVGLPDDLFGVFDRGLRRSMGDHLMEDARYIEPCNYLSRLILTSSPRDQRRTPSPEETLAILNALRPDLKAQLEAAPQKKRGLTAAPVRATWALRYHYAPKDQQQLLREQWAAFVNEEFTELDPTTGAGLRRLNATNNTRAQGITTQDDRAAVGWMMWHPTQRGLVKLMVRDIGTILGEVRGAVRSVLPRKPSSQGRGRPGTTVA